MLLKLVDTAPDVLAALARVTTGTAAVKAKTKLRSKVAVKKKVGTRGVKKKSAERRSVVA